MSRELCICNNPDARQAGRDWGVWWHRMDIKNRDEVCSKAFSKRAVSGMQGRKVGQTKQKHCIFMSPSSSHQRGAASHDGFSLCIRVMPVLRTDRGRQQDSGLQSHMEAAERIPRQNLQNHCLMKLSHLGLHLATGNRNRPESFKQTGSHRSHFTRMLRVNSPGLR